MEKVTVIIPTYKRAESLERAINSVLNQTYKNLELIVVDDNNEDSEYRLANEKRLNKYKELKNFKYIKHSKNKNGAAARNTGIQYATGDYITFLDDDDIFLPTRIVKMVNLLKDNPSYGGAYSSVAICKNKRIINVIEANKDGSFELDLLKQKSFFGTGSNLFIKKEIIEKIGDFDINFTRHQDIEYMIRFFEYSNIKSINEILVIKCIEDQNNKLNYEKMIEVKRLFFKKFDNNIRKYQKEEKSIYFRNILELLNKTYDNKIKYKIIKKELTKYGVYSYKEKIKYFFRKFLYKHTACRKILDYLRSLKYSKLTKKLNIEKK